MHAMSRFKQLVDHVLGSYEAANDIGFGVGRALAHAGGVFVASRLRRV